MPSLSFKRPVFKPSWFRRKPKKETHINSRDNLNELVDDLREISEVKEDHKNTKLLLHMEDDETSRASVKDRSEVVKDSSELQPGKYNLF